ncbi:MAG: methionine biosynthesis protein MetW [Gammaproteobacteria bacterium]
MSVISAELRPEMKAIIKWIKPNSRVLDLGCGDGTLLKYLQDNLNVTGYGLEIDDDNIVQCIKNGVNVIQTNLDAGLSDFDNNSFDYVIMTQTLQAIQYPDKLLEEILRIGREGIVTFPNFGYWSCRLQLLLGRMPVTPSLSHQWFDTPNIHLCTLKNFEDFCHEKAIKIMHRSVGDNEHINHISINLFPNLMGQIALYRIQKQ